MKTHPVRSHRFRALAGVRWQNSHLAALGFTLLLRSSPSSAGPAVSASNGETLRHSRHSVASATPWRERRLAYSDVLLSTVVAEFNRHNRHQIRLEGPVPNAMRLSCSTEGGYPLGLLLFLMSEPSLIVQPDGEDWVVRGREPTSDLRE